MSDRASVCVFALLLVGVVLVFRCGGESGSSSGEVATAAKKSWGAGTARLSISGTIKWPGDRGRVRYSAEGAVDYVRRAARLRLRPLRSDTPVGGFAASEMRGELIVHPRVVYARSGALARRFGLDRGRWLRVPIVPRVEAEGIDFRPIGESINGVWSLGQLRASRTSVERLGEETVAGVPTTRYRTTLQRRRGRMKTVSIPTQVWVDGSGFVRRVEQRYSSGGPAKYVTSWARRVEFRDFGSPANIEEPPRGRVTSARIATALREARRSSGYRLYFAGRSFRGRPLTAVVKSKDPIGPPALPGQPPERKYTSYSFIYGSCAPPRDPRTGLADGGCGPPIEIKNGQTCARPPPRQERSPQRLRGLPAYSLRRDYVALHPGRTAIVIFTSETEAAGVAAQLRSLDGRIGPRQPLPKTAPGALAGRRRCPS